MPFIALAAAIVLALGGGASIAANNSLPGDAFYPVKINVNEKIEGAFSFSHKSQANWDVEAAENRLEEAAKLSASGKLSSTTLAELSANFDAHINSVKAHIERMQAKGEWGDAAEVAAKFQATVAKHASVLAEASAHADVQAQAVLSGIISRVQATLNAAAALSVNASAQAAAHGEATTDDKDDEKNDDNATSSARSGNNNDDHGAKVQGNTRVKVDLNGDGEDDGTPDQGRGDGSVNVRL